MDITGKTQQEIQQLIFEELKAGKTTDSIKAKLIENGQKPEGYYFTSQEDYNRVIEEPKTAAGQLSGWQIFWGIVVVIIMILRIARCSNRM